MYRLYKGIQVDRGFIRGLVIHDSNLEQVKQNHTNYRIEEEIAFSPTKKGLNADVRKFQATAATPERPEAKYAVMELY